MVPVLKAAVRPAEGVAVITTVPPKPSKAVIVIIDVPETPALRVSVVGFAAIWKSTKVNVAVVVWIIAPLVPVTVRVYVKAVGDLHEMVEVLLLAMLEDENAPQLNPRGTASVRTTVPAKP